MLKTRNIRQKFEIVKLNYLSPNRISFEMHKNNKELPTLFNYEKPQIEQKRMSKKISICFLNAKLNISVFPYSFPWTFTA